MTKFPYSRVLCVWKIEYTLTISIEISPLIFQQYNTFPKFVSHMNNNKSQDNINNYSLDLFKKARESNHLYSYHDGIRLC